MGSRRNASQSPLLRSAVPGTWGTEVLPPGEDREDVKDREMGKDYGPLSPRRVRQGAHTVGFFSGEEDRGARKHSGYSGAGREQGIAGVPGSEAAEGASFHWLPEADSFHNPCPACWLAPSDNLKPLKEIHDPLFSSKQRPALGLLLRLLL